MMKLRTLLFKFVATRRQLRCYNWKNNSIILNETFKSSMFSSAQKGNISNVCWGICKINILVIYRFSLG